MSKSNGIAIVGMDCRYPGASNLEQYWENILSLRRAFRRIPKERLSLDDYFSPSRADLDSTYSTQAAVLSDYQFDRVRFRVSKDTFSQTDMTHWLALEVASGALKDAGFEDGEGLDKSRAGVILGNSLTGEFSRSYLMRLRWPYVQRVLQSVLAETDRGEEETARLMARTESVYKAAFGPPNADTLAGGLSNTIAGRICNHFNFNGGGYTVDGACSSSLLAFAHGCNSLEQGDLDVALVGGVDLSIDPFEIIGFARTGALAEKEMRVYDSRSEGFWPGEGCGVAVLMRADDARAKGLSIYAEIKGWGISSDGSGGITRPKAETQRLAFRRAYAKAGYGIDSIDYFEGHGTGTPVGDAEELTALTSELAASGKTGNPAVVGSVKELIGHTKAAAGAAGAIKAALALKHGLIPQSLPGRSTHPILGASPGALSTLESPVAWSGSRNMRASVSGMGFGGINVHITMEAARKSTMSRRRLEVLASPKWDAEVFPLGAANREKLQARIRDLKTWASACSLAELTDLSATLCSSRPANSPWRACVVAGSTEELTRGFDKLSAWLDSGEERLFDVDARVFGTSPAAPRRIGFLFPGQGTPIHLNPGIFASFSSFMEDRYKSLPAHLETTNTALAQPSIMASSLGALELLSNLGVEADLALGHSLGEITALSWSGALDPDGAMDLARHRGSIMTSHGHGDAGMVALQCDASQVENVLEGSGAHISCLNGRNQFVVGGRTAQLGQVEAKALSLGISFTRLKVARAFHTPLMGEAQAPFKEFLSTIPSRNGSRKIYSTITGGVMGQEDWKSLLVDQFVEPVRFQQALDAASREVDFFLEVGPGQPLCKALQSESGIRCLPVEFGGKSIRGFLTALSAAFCSGRAVAFEKVFENRFYRPVDIERPAVVLVNPCELAPLAGAAAQKARVPAQYSEEPAPIATVLEGAEASGPGVPEEDVLGYMKALVAARTEIPVSVLRDGDKVLSGLHLNSLVISDIVAQVAKRFRKSHETFSAATVLASADATLGEIARKMEEGAAAVVDAAGEAPSLPDTKWVHVFTEDWQARPPAALIQSEGIYLDFDGLGEADWVDSLKALSQSSSSRKGVLYVSSGGGCNEVGPLLDSLKKALLSKAGVFVLVEPLQDLAVSLAPILRTFKLENPGIRCAAIQVRPGERDLAERIRLEISRLGAYSDIKLEDGKAFRKIYKARFTEETSLADSLGKEDILLATGGGKGITFESARELARRTGAKLGLIGRADPAKDAQLRENLKALAEEGIAYCYRSGDVLDPDAIGESVRAISAALGHPTALLHGAGINRPKRLDQLEVADFNATWAVKVEGLRNVLAAVDPESLRHLVAYGSIIARSGMQGNADYAMANEALAVEVEAFHRQHPSCRCLVMEWSVWDETGMGANLNTLESLRRLGVQPIPVARGNELLVQLMGEPRLPGIRFVVAGRYGSMPTFDFAAQALPFCRFTTDVKRIVPGVEITARTLLSRATDLYFDHHRFKGQFIFPTVMALEAMTQAASALQSRPGAPKFTDLRISKPILVPPQGGTPILVTVERETATRFHASIRLEGDGPRECFSATLDFAPCEAPGKSAPGSAQALDLEVAGSVYDPLLFHTGPFRRIRSYSHIDGWRSSAEAETDGASPWFSPELPQTLLLGDAGLNDACIHCHQASRPHYNLLPSGLASLEILAIASQGPVRIETEEVGIQGRDILIDVHLFDSAGRLLQRWKGMRMTPVIGTRYDGPWNPHLVVPYFQHMILEHFGERVAIRRVETGGLPRLEAVDGSGASQFEVSLDGDAGEDSGVGEWSVDDDSETIRACIRLEAVGNCRIAVRRTPVTSSSLEGVA